MMKITWSHRPKGCYKSIVSLFCLSVLFASFPLSACAPTAPPPTENITITVPQGTSNHGNANLICTPSTWTDIATFFLANFVAHAATVKSVPGESGLPALLALVLALLLPAMGVRRGLSAIYQRAVLADTPLKTAARAGALCIVVRTSKWKPQTGDVVEVLDYMGPRQLENAIVYKPDLVFKATKEKRFIDGDEWDWTRIDHVPAEVLGRGEKARMMLLKFYFYQVLRRKEKEQEVSQIPALVLSGKSYLVDAAFGDGTFQPSSSSMGTSHRKIYGICQLPEGYALSVVPPGAQVDELQSSGNTPCTTELSSNYNLPKALTAIFQTLYASATLYQVRGNQLQRYGYSAFGLTVAPYLVMSVINLASTMLTPDYPAMYLVISEAMEEAQRRKGSKFEGMVGTVRKNNLSKEPFAKIRFEVKDDGRTLMRGSDPESYPKLPTEVLLALAERGPPVDIRTGKFHDRPVHRLIHRLYSRPNQPFLLIPRSSELPSSIGRQKMVERVILTWGSMAVGSIPVAIIAGLSHFKSGQSKFAQRAWTMTWLSFGICFGPSVGLIPLTFRLYIGNVLPYLAPSIGGFVVVGQMLMQYGNCIQL